MYVVMYLGKSVLQTMSLSILSVIGKYIPDIMFQNLAGNGILCFPSGIGKFKIRGGW